MSTVPPEAGKSSFDLLDREVFLPRCRWPMPGEFSTWAAASAATRFPWPSTSRREPRSTASISGGGDRSTAPRGTRTWALQRDCRGGDVVHLASVADGQVDLALASTIVHDLAERGRRDRF